MKHVEKTTDTQAKQKCRSILLQGTSIGLCLAMGLSLAGCGSKGKTDSVKTIAADAAYFSVQDLDYYKQAEGEQSNLVSVTACKDKTAVLINVFDASNNPILYKEGMMGSAVETVAAETVAATETAAASDATNSSDTSGDVAPPDETTAVTDGTTDPGEYVQPMTKYFILFYDNLGKLVSQTDLSSYFDVNTSIMNMLADQDGNLVILAQTYDPVTYAASFQLFKFDTDGNAVGDPISLTIAANSYPSQVVIDKDGNILYTGYDDQGKATISVLDSKGKPLYDISAGSENLSGMMYLVGDTIYVDGYQSDEKTYKYLFFPVDTAGRKLGEPIDMTTLSSMGGSGFYITSDAIYSSDSIGVYSIDLKTKKKTAVMLWKDADIKGNPYGNQRIIVLSVDKIMMIGSTYSQTGSETTVSLLTREAKNPNAGKKIITIAGVGISASPDVLAAVYNFNTANSKYRVEIHDYMENQPINSQEDYNKILSAMNMEILSGEGPDVVYSSNQSFANYEAKGLFTDLYTLMEKDTSFKKDDYLPSIMKLCETDGHLYKFGTSFSINGFAGAKSVIGDRMGWTVDEFNDVVNTLPSGMAPLANQTQITLLTASLSASMDTFIDSAKGEVTFDTPEFYQLLDYAKTYGTADDLSKDGGVYVDEQTMLQNGELAMTNCNIYDPSSYAQYITMVGGPISVVGYPSSDKRGPMCYMNTLLSISSSSGSKQAAWDFVKSFFSVEAQTNTEQIYQIPVMKTAFEAQIEKAMNPDTTNGGMGNIYDKMGQVIPMTEEAAKAYRDLVNGLDTLAVSDQEIVNIVLEEVPEYFNGGKSDKDVAKIIQDRVQTLVNER